MSSVGSSVVRGASPCWRSVRIGGRAALRSPEGAVYYGTAAEVRGACLCPHRRRMLAQSLRVVHFSYLRGTVGLAEVAAFAAERWREAIQHGSHDGAFPHMVGSFPLSEVLRIGAAARSLGVDADEFVRRAVAGAVDEAERTVGGLAFTRHEAAALARC